MKHSNRILAYSALALVVMLAAFGAIAFDTSNVAYAQGTGTVPAAPALMASASGANSIQLTWNAVDDAENYELWAWDSVDEWQRLDGGESDPLTGLSFTHGDLTDGRTYYYQIRAINADGGMSAWSARVNEVAGNAPARPELTLTAGYEQITVSWAPVTDAVRYELFAWDGSWAQLDGGAADPLLATTYTQTGLTAGRTIYYQARAVNAGGVMSAWSAQVNAVVLSTSTVSAPQTLTASAGNGQVALNWAAPANNSGLGVDGYHYRYGETGGTMGEWTGAGDVLTVTISGLTNSTGYTFEVRAYNSGGNGPASSVNATPLDAPSVPGTPGSLRAAPSSDRVTLTWTAPADNGAAISGYQYQSYETSGTAPSTWTNAGNVLSVVVSNLTKGTSYTFNVRAMNSVGPGGAATATATPSSKPSMPQNLRATGSHGIMTLSWDAPADNGGTAIVNYRIEKYNTTTTNWALLRTVPGTTYTDDSVAAGVTSDYRVRALNANTNAPSDWATASGVALSMQVPSEPQDLKATSGNRSITYSWGAPASSGGTAITRYEYKQWNSAETAPDTWTSTSLRTNASRSNLDAAATYNFQVRAVNSIGEGAVESLTNTPAATKPDLPRRFEARADLTDAEIEVSWREPDDTGGEDIDGYHLQSKMGADGTWADIDTFEVQDDNTEDEFDHTGLLSGVTYYYRIRAFNSHNETVAEDDIVWSPEIDATTRSTEPTAPAQATVTFEDGSLKVDWMMPSANGEDISTYKIRWKIDTDTTTLYPPDGYPPANVVSVQAPITEYIIRGPAPAEDYEPEDYEFQILAVNSEGESEWSTASAPFTVDPPAEHPTAGANANALVPTVTAEGKATISWRMADDDNYTVASYVLQWVVVDRGATPDWTSDDVKNMDFAAQALMEHVVEELPGMKDLHVRVRTVTTVGTMSDWPTTTSPIEIPARAPSLPVLEAMLIGTNVILTWNMPESNGAPITQFELQFKKDDGEFGDHDGADDSSANADADPDNPDNDVIVFEGDSNVDPVVPIPTTYIHENLAADATYTYRIRAVSTVNDGEDADGDGTGDVAVTGNDRKWSLEAKAETDPSAEETPVPPSTPVLTDPLTANDEDGQIELSWTKPAEGTSDITSYELMRWNGSDWEDLEVSLGAEDTEYADTTVELGREYWYAIRAISDAGAGKWTQSGFLSMMLAPKAPDEPMVTASVDGQSITLSWAAPANNGSPITSYTVQSTNMATVDENGDARTEVERDWQAVNRPAGEPAAATTITHSGVTPGETRYYRVRAVNTATPADGEWSEEVEARAAPNAPAVPTGLDASDNEDRQVTLDWTLAAPNSAGTGGAAITSVEVRRWISSTGRWETIGTVDVSVMEDAPNSYKTSSLTYEDTGLEPGTMYSYQVRAVNEAGAGDWTAVNNNGATPSAVPDAPVLTATAEGQSIVLTWTVPDGNGESIDYYEIQRLPSVDTEGESQNDWGDADATTTGDADVIVPEPEGVTTYTDSNVEPGTTYNYRIRAVNSDGDGEWSATDRDTTPATAPDRVVVTITGGDKMVTLTWDPPVSDGGASVSAYQIIQWDTDQSAWKPVRDDLPPSLRTFDVTELEAGTTYFFRIRAVNSAGEGPWSTFQPEATDPADE